MHMRVPSCRFYADPKSMGHVQTHYIVAESVLHCCHHKTGPACCMQYNT